MFPCWFTVYDAGPALTQHWRDDSRLVCWDGYKRLPVAAAAATQQTRDIEPTFGQRLLFAR